MSFSSTDYAVTPTTIYSYWRTRPDLILTLTSARRGSHAVLIDCIDQGLKREAKARRREDGGRAPPPSVAAWGLKRGATFSDEEREGDAKRSARVATRSSQRSKASFWRF